MASIANGFVFRPSVLVGFSETASTHMSHDASSHYFRPLVDTIRRVAAFGMALMPLDLRQESARHTEALDTITKHLGIGSYAEWDEVQRREWLVQV